MKTNLLFLSLSILSVFLFSCKTDVKFENTVSPELVYDSVKVTKYGSDDYGMKKYVMAFLKKGPNRSTDSVEVARLQKAHLENIFRMADEGKLVLAGPFLDHDSIRGIYIFDVPTLEEARKLTESDPAIQAGSLTMELHEWYGSAALMEVNTIHKTLEKKNIIDN